MSIWGIRFCELKIVEFCDLLRLVFFRDELHSVTIVFNLFTDNSRLIADVFESKFVGS